MKRTIQILVTLAAFALTFALFSSLSGHADASTAHALSYGRDNAGDLVQRQNGQIITWYCVMQDHKVYALADLPQSHGCDFVRSHSN
jgi:hypothetical protein